MDKKRAEKMVVHAEADMGSSLINLTIENADAAQLFALAEMIRTNGQIALAQQMTHEAMPAPSPLRRMT